MYWTTPNAYIFYIFAGLTVIVSIVTVIQYKRRVFIGFWKASAILFLTFAGLFGLIFVCFNLFLAGGIDAPPWIFTILSILYGVFLIGFYIWYLSRFPDRVRYLPGDPFNGLLHLKKGLGGKTFADFATSIGLAVTVGGYLTFESLVAETWKPCFWWTAQIAALVSVISTASLVQRFIVEGPTGKKKFTDEPKPWERILNAHLNGISAILAAVAILIPTQKNLDNLSISILPGDNPWNLWMDIIWLTVFGLWLASTIHPWIKATRMPQWQSGWIFGYFGWTFIYTLLMFVFIAICLAAHQRGWIWDNLARYWIGAIAAGLFSIRQLFRVLFILWEWCRKIKIDKYRYLDLERNFLLLLGGIMMAYVQTGILVNNDSLAVPDLPYFKYIYTIFLVIMVIGSLIGIMRDILKIIESTSGTPPSMEAEAMALALEKVSTLLGTTPVERRQKVSEALSILRSEARIAKDRARAAEQQPQA